MFRTLPLTFPGISQNHWFWYRNGRHVVLPCRGRGVTAARWMSKFAPTVSNFNVYDEMIRRVDTVTGGLVVSVLCALSLFPSNLFSSSPLVLSSSVSSSDSHSISVFKVHDPRVVHLQPEKNFINPTC